MEETKNRDKTEGINRACKVYYRHVSYELFMYCIQIMNRSWMLCFRVGISFLLLRFMMALKKNQNKEPKETKMLCRAEEKLQSRW